MTEDPSGQTPPVVNKKKAWYMRKWVWAVAILVVIIAIIPTDEETGAADEARTLETAAEAPVDEGPVAEPEPEPAPEPIVFSGRGDYATETFQLEEGLVRLQAEHQGSSNFAIKLLDGNGDLQELPVNEIGSYSGSRAFSVRSGTYLLDVTASGPWTIQIQQ